ncbi:hypothetical protein MNV49_000919 [Pseudohyphozyma bogoriensis]|nr:hypothetical protein MNV49_000919 [Pseudohyphozyma bogoriensis]
MVALMDEGEYTGALWGGQLLLPRLPLVTTVLLETPPTEDGGDPRLGYTRQVKLSALQTIRRNLSTVAWAFPKLARSPPELQATIAQIEALQNVSLTLSNFSTPVAPPNGGITGFSDDFSDGILSTDEINQILGEMVQLPGIATSGANDPFMLPQWNGGEARIWEEPSGFDGC